MLWIQTKLNLIKRHWKEWYQGKYVPPPPNDPNSPIVRISPGHYEKPLLAKWIESFLGFWHDHWKWLIGIMITLIALMIALIALIFQIRDDY